jgi:hypothetical protein
MPASTLGVAPSELELEHDDAASNALAAVAAMRTRDRVIVGIVAFSVTG